MNKRYKIGRWLLFCSPFIIGAYGLFYVEGMPLKDALFSSMTMYFLNYGDVPPNLFVEFARWTAPLMTASGVIFVVSALRRNWHNWIVYMQGGSVAVYGDSDESYDILAELGKKGIAGSDNFVQADRYILLGEEQENFLFYRTNKSKLDGKKVYLRASSLRAQSVIGGDLKLFCPEETGARLYWKQAELYEAARKSDYHLKIVLLGFGKLGEEVLLWGLQDNIFSPSQKIEYHVFGNDEGFMDMHHELSSVTDTVKFYSDPWYQRISLLQEADRVIVCSQQDQTELLKDLIFAIEDIVFDVFMAESSTLDFLEDQERIRLFMWKREAQRLCNLLDETLLERAKRINLRYAHIYGGVPENDEMKEKEWKALDSFTRYSNISSADYHEIQLQMLRSMGVPAELEHISEEQLELLAELEHIRWCRYHYLNNWNYGIPANGKNKDKQKRIHTDLIPYEKLSDEDKEKDRENIRILLSIKL